MPNSKPFSAVTVNGKNLNEQIYERCEVLRTLKYSDISPAQRETITLQLKALRRANFDLLLKEMDETTQALIDASTTLKNGAADAKKALEEIDKVSKVIENTAQVIAFLAKVIVIIGDVVV